MAEPQAHFLLHAFLMSPILRLWHHNFRNTSLPKRQSTPQGMISISFN
ncbi:protein YnhH [Cronobacter sakazakii]